MAIPKYTQKENLDEKINNMHYEDEKWRSIINTKDRLNLYLVEHNLKPSTIVNYFPAGEYVGQKLVLPISQCEKYDELIKRSDFLRSNYNQINVRFQNFKDNFLPELKMMGDSVSKHHLEFRKPCTTFSKEGDNFFINESESYTGIYSKKPDFVEELAYLLNNDEIKGSKAYNARMGQLLGYPQEDIESFNINTALLNVNNLINLRKALSLRLTIPSWYLYLSHIPTNFDVINQNYSEGAKDLGEIYEKYVKMQNPSLDLELKENTIISLGLKNLR